MIGRTISHYKILEELGKGGMGVVYKARDTKLDRTVALKFLPPDLVRDEDVRKRFEHEAKAAAALDHTNICTIFEIDHTDDQTFIAMAYVEGQTLKERIEAGRLEIDEVISIGSQIASGLGAAHGKGIVHRDIKPANIIITSEGQAKIMDFGVAKSARLTTTAPGTTLGTVAYMSPEQARGDAVDYRTDIWSLGVVLYEMATGQRPFKGDYEQAVIYAILNEDPLPPMTLRDNVPSGLDRTILRALARDPEERYSSTSEVVRDLRGLKGRMETPLPAGPSGRRRGLRRVAMVLAPSVLLVVVLAFIASRLLSDLDSGHKAGAIRSVAVLPLDNLSGDLEQEYFADGMTEALITELSKIKALRVISRTSVMQYKGASKPLPEIARELSVDAVVEGSVVQAEDRVRITAQLIEAKTDKHLWAEAHEREMRDILTLQREVARSIAREIRVVVTPEEQVRLETAQAVDPEAHEAYLRGRYHINRWTEGSIRTGIEYLQRAVETDPEYALAHAALAHAYDLLATLGWMSPEEGYELARAEAEKALEIDNSVAEAHIILAFVKFFDWDWDAVETAALEAIDVNPGYALAHAAYGGYLMIMGRHEEAIQATKHARDLDPLSTSTSVVMVRRYYAARQYDRAISLAQEVIRLDPSVPDAHQLLGRAFLETQAYDKAIREFREAERLGDSWARSLLACVFAESGDHPRAKEILDDLVSHPGEVFDSAYKIAEIYASLGETDQAFEWLEKAYEGRNAHIVFLKTDPVLDSLRPDPRFDDLLRRTGFIE